MKKGSTFSYTSIYPCSASQLHAWHGRPGALERLLPPWERTRVLSRKGGLDPGGEVELQLRLGMIPLRYVAHHIENIPGKMFRDIQAKGPFAQWSHSHFFTDTEYGARLDDVVEYRLPGHNLLPGFVKRKVEKRLLQMFRHRERIIQADIRLHNTCSPQPMRLLISGASGVLGRELVPLLTTGGHTVYRLVRRKPDPAQNEIFWDPDQNILSADQLPEVDGVIHLAGEYIGLYRWTEEKKKKVLDSRVRGTSLLARTLAGLDNKPKVFLSASAVGFYGNSGAQIVDENNPPGGDFISEICIQWEKATEAAQLAGIRTVCMRLGIGITPRGGALERILETSPFGFVRCFGSGEQYISWMSYDDIISAMLHCLVHTGLSGPVNIAAPQPATNREFMTLLAKITGRPLLLPVPEWFLGLIYGQMASEIVLSGCRVATKKLTESGFTFRHTSLQQALTLLLGRSS
jgi:uncharacterized protein (TIGR01777 family)